MRKPFVAGNWKMNGNMKSCRQLAETLGRELPGIAGVEACVCPPFPYLAAVVDALRGTPVSVGAQDLHWEKDGAVTGEVSAAMLCDLGCAYVIVGHSERRHGLGETDDMVRRKTAAALAAGIRPIVCVGELLDEREKGMTEQVVARHVSEALKGLTAHDVVRVTIAYEPVWAIGTGRTATPQQANDVHLFIRELVRKQFGCEAAESLRIQYGGSVKPDNAVDLMRQSDIDGALVGGASLKADSFKAIVAATS